MNDAVAIHDILIQSAVFQEWVVKHPRAYLASFFQITPGDEERWQIDYYEKDSDEMTAFSVEPISKKATIDQERSKVFKEAATVVDELRLQKVRLPIDDAVEIAETTAGKYYPGEVVSKKIIILQRIRHELFNITFLTTALSTINVRIDASSGDVTSHEKAMIGMQMR